MYLGSYLLERLKQLGVDTMFGCPGDFNFGLCDLTDDMPDMAWAGNTNELNAAYAADAYSRVRGFAAFLTTYGVGELSAINGVAGAYAERSPLLHIAGFPPLWEYKKRLPVHHSLANGNYMVYLDAARNFACAAEFLDGTPADADRIDHVLRMSITTRLPGYLAIPTDVTFTDIPEERLKTPLIAPPAYSDDQRRADEALAQRIVDALKKAKSPILVVDAGLLHHRHVDAMRKVLDQFRLMTFTTPLGKGIANETEPYFAGTYIGKQSEAGVAQRVDSADLVVRIGYFPSDNNTGAYSANFPADRLIELNIYEATVLTDAPVPVHRIAHVLETLAASDLPPQNVQANQPPSVPQPTDDIARQQYLWARFSAFLEPGDVVLAETGTSGYALPNLHLRKDCQVLAQQLYESIGWSVGATVGAAHSVRDASNRPSDKSGRVILFVGDGSLQMTVQDLSALIRMKARNVIVCVLDNDGYEIERILHGRDRDYNHVVHWDYARLMDVMDPKGEYSKSIRVNTEKELDRVLSELKGDIPLHILTVCVEKYGVPDMLSVSAKALHDHNAYGYPPEYRD
ncbi:hypothetical protein CBS9595_004127 [Malassezia furfur]|nr:hypothetical protein CBS9595_004127 [Malassezia furfur]